MVEQIKSSGETEAACNLLLNYKLPCIESVLSFIISHKETSPALPITATPRCQSSSSSTEFLTTQKRNTTLQIKSCGVAINCF